MKDNFRLTVHLEDVQKVGRPTGEKVKNKKGKWEQKTTPILYNTLSFYCKTKDDCLKKLTEVKTKHKVAVGKAGKHKPHKLGKDLYNISFVN